MEINPFRIHAMKKKKSLFSLSSNEFQFHLALSSKILNTYSPIIFILGREFRIVLQQSLKITYFHIYSLICYSQSPKGLIWKLCLPRQHIVLLTECAYLWKGDKDYVGRRCLNGFSKFLLSVVTIL